MAQHDPSHVASSQKALMLEMKSLQEEPVEGFKITLVDEADLYNWEVAIFGPPNTHYEGGYFKVRREQNTTLLKTVFGSALKHTAHSDSSVSVVPPSSKTQYANLREHEKLKGKSFSELCNPVGRYINSPRIHRAFLFTIQSKKGHIWLCCHLS